MLWEYASAVVMFVRFDVQSSSAAATTTNGNMSSIQTYSEVNNVVSELEDVVLKHQVQKVKSIGNIFMAVSGIYDDDVDPIASMFRAAADVRQTLDNFFSPHHLQREVAAVITTTASKGPLPFKEAPTTKKMGDTTFAIGICCGPCFGAVIGVKGLCFDIFGDTVNTASRMCSTAPNGCIQMTDNTRMSTIVSGQVPELLCIEKAVAPVSVKGKGLMEVFHLKLVCPRRAKAKVVTRQTTPKRNIPESESPCLNLASGGSPN